VPEIHTNGCKLAREPVISRRRSARTGGTGYTPATRTRPLPSWALSPQAVEAIRVHILSRAGQREAILAHRDATVVSLQYGLASRNQELWGLRWSSLDGEFAWITEVLARDEADEAESLLRRVADNPSCPVASAWADLGRAEVDRLRGDAHAGDRFAELARLAAQRGAHWLGTQAAIGLGLSGDARAALIWAALPAELRDDSQDPPAGLGQPRVLWM
jgi:hypothetical protein